MKRRRGWVRWFLLGASYAGFVIALYLTFVHYRGYVSPCYVVSGCEQVQTSRFSEIMGVPVALLGVVYFAVMFYMGIALKARASARTTLAYKVLALVGALAVIPLFLLQAISLRAFCSYCVATEAVMLSIWVVSFFLPPDGRREAAAAGARARS